MGKWVGMEEYPDFVKSTGYGDGLGLCGWNCRHNFIPFNPKTMKNNLQQYGLEENKEMYLNHQKQRYFERNIRKYKKVVGVVDTALKACTDPKARKGIAINLRRSKELLRKWTDSYKDFSAEKGLRTQLERTKVIK